MRRRIGRYSTLVRPGPRVRSPATSMPESVTVTRRNISGAADGTLATASTPATSPHPRWLPQRTGAELAHQHPELRLHASKPCLVPRSGTLV
jgi:hypothetical protein